MVLTAALIPSSEPTPVARRLAYAGLVPFIAGALLAWLVRDDTRPYVVAALAAYAAVILGFLGGIHWGLAWRHAEPPPALLAWGVVPSLLAWPAVLMPPAAGLVILGALLVACYAVDRRVYPTHGAANWLLLRFRLSAVAAPCCFIAAAAL